MNPQNKWLKVVGFVLNALIAAMILFAGASKVFAPAGFEEPMKKIGLEDRILLIGCGELITAILLLIPWTSPLGTLLASGFWGGVICIHMAHHEDFIVPSVLLAVTWFGSCLRGSVPLLALRSGPIMAQRHSI